MDLTIENQSNRYNIGQMAFYNRNLSTTGSFNIPNNVNLIGLRAFSCFPMSSNPLFNNVNFNPISNINIDAKVINPSVFENRPISGNINLTNVSFIAAKAFSTGFKNTASTVGVDHPGDNERVSINITTDFRLGIGAYAFSNLLVSDINISCTNRYFLSYGVFANCNISGNVILSEGCESIPTYCFGLSPDVEAETMKLQPYSYTRIYNDKENESAVYHEIACAGKRQSSYKTLLAVNKIDDPNHIYNTINDKYKWYAGDNMNITLPPSLKYISPFAFYNRKISNTTLKFPDSLTFIGQCAFRFLEFKDPGGTIIFPRGLEYLGIHSFYGITNVNTIYLGENLRYGTDGELYSEVMSDSFSVILICMIIR
jgi:hypothetical protein